MGLNCITGNQFDVVVAEGYRIGSGAGKCHAAQTVAAVCVVIAADTARSQDQKTVPKAVAARHGHGGLSGIRGKRTFVQHHGIFCGNLGAHGDVVGFRSKIVGEVIVLFIVQDQPDHIAVFQAVCRNIQRNVAGLLSQLADNPFVAVHTAVFHRAQESVHCSDAGIAAGNGKGDLGTVRRQSPLGRDGEQRGCLGCGHRYRLGLCQLAAVGQERRQFFSGGQRIRECQSLLARGRCTPVGQESATAQQAVRVLRTCIISFQHNVGALRNLTAQLHRHAGIPRLGHSLNGHCGDILLRRAGNQHRVVRTLEHGFVVVALGQEDVLVLLPVGHGADTPPRLQRLRQRHLIVHLWLREDQVGGQGNLLFSFEVKGSSVIGILAYCNGNRGLSFFCRLEQPLIAGQVDVQLGSPRLQRGFHNGGIGIGIVPEALSAGIHHFQCLRVRGFVKILPYRHIQAGNHITIQGQFLIERAGHCLPVLYISCPQPLVVGTVRIKRGVGRIGEDCHVALLQRRIQRDLYIHRRFALFEALRPHRAVFHQGSSGVLENFLRRFFAGFVCRCDNRRFAVAVNGFVCIAVILVQVCLNGVSLCQLGIGCVKGDGIGARSSKGYLPQLTAAVIVVAAAAARGHKQPSICKFLASGNCYGGLSRFRRVGTFV